MFMVTLVWIKSQSQTPFE